MSSFSRISVLLLAAGCLAWTAACRKSRDASGQLPSRGEVREVHAAPGVFRPMERKISVTGTLAPQEKSVISAKVSGRLEQLAVDIGSSVRQGDLIAQVEPRDYELRVLQAAAALAGARVGLGLPMEGENDRADAETISAVKQANALLEEASKNLERLRSLSRSSIVSTSELDTVEAAFKVAHTRCDAAREEARARLAALAERRAEYQTTRKQLDDASVRAPFAGTIQQRFASVGEFVAPGTPIAALVATDPLRLRLEVPERESILVCTGQLVRLTVEGASNLWSGRIVRLSPALNETNRMLLVEADVPNPGRLRAGLFARAEIVINEREEGWTIPPSAVVTFAGIEKVLTVRGGKALEKTVTTGRRGPDWVEIVSGIEPGTLIVLDPGGTRSGQAVTVVPATAPRETGAAAKARESQGN